MTATLATKWMPVCPLERLQPERGVAVLLPDGRQAALFRLHDGELAVVSNVDPFSGAAVISRGIVGDSSGEPTVASPMYKQRFSLRTGRCLDDESVALGTFPVRVGDDGVEIGYA